MLPEPPITYLDDGVNWRLDAEIASPSLGYLLIVPQGRISDLASVPELGWNVVAPFQLSIRAAFVHDEIYRHGGTITVRIQGDAILIDRKHQFTRAEADAFLLDIAKQQNVPLWRRQSAYWAVRLFGGSSWQSKAVPPSPESVP